MPNCSTISWFVTASNHATEDGVMLAWTGGHFGHQYVQSITCTGIENLTRTIRIQNTQVTQNNTTRKVALVNSTTDTLKKTYAKSFAYCGGRSPTVQPWSWSINYNVAMTFINNNNNNNKRQERQPYLVAFSSSQEMERFYFFNPGVRTGPNRNGKTISRYACWRTIKSLVLVLAT